MRVSISRSLVINRPIMIYDEPVASLDDKNAKIIFDRLLSLDVTVIIISHKIYKECMSSFDEVIEI